MTSFKPIVLFGFAFFLWSCGPNAEQQQRQTEYDAATKEIKGWLKFPHTVRIATLSENNTDSCRVETLSNSMILVTMDYHAENGMGNFVPDVARVLLTPNGKTVELYLEQGEWEKSFGSMVHNYGQTYYYGEAGRYQTKFTRDSIIKLLREELRRNTKQS